LINHAAKQQGVGPGDVFGCVTMQFFVRDTRSMIAAPVQGDIDGKL
jgi:hypothetical protein